MRWVLVYQNQFTGSHAVFGLFVRSRAAQKTPIKNVIAVSGITKPIIILPKAHVIVAWVNRVLNAAAMSYVAATATAILTLLYFVLRSGLLGRR